MGIFLFKKEQRSKAIDNYLDGADIEDAVVQKVVQPGHLVKHKLLVLVHRVS